MKSILIAAVVALCAAVAVPAVAHKGGKHKGHKPSVIALPPGFQPEGITTSKRHTFFVGSRATGAIYKGSLRSGEGDELVAGGDGKQATGLKVDRFGRLFVSGAGSQAIRVYDSRTGALIREYSVPEANFINDVVITRNGAYFTESQVIPQLYFIPFGKKGALGELQRIQITGDFVYTADQFNANGIEAAKGGKTLILVSSHDGALYTADAVTGATNRITVTGMDGELKNGDGIMLKGRKLYVVENRDGAADGVTEGTGEVSVVKLSKDLTAGEIVREISNARFDVPTTIARSGGRNYVVNAKFNTPPTPTTPYEVVKVPKK
jgi:sugar lactone lactonase YvrE